MTEISFVNSSENDNSFKTEENIILAQEKNCDLVKPDDNYEFNESDSHITDLVKDYCDGEENLSDTEHGNKLSSEFRMIPIPKRSYSSLSMDRNVPHKKFKISSIFKEDLQESIFRFKIDLFNRVSGKTGSQTSSIYYFKSRSLGNIMHKAPKRTSKFFPEDSTSIENIKSAPCAPSEYNESKMIL
jgi:hypothetical protein